MVDKKILFKIHNKDDKNLSPLLKNDLSKRKRLAYLVNKGIGQQICVCIKC